MSKFFKLFFLAITVFFISACGGNATKDAENTAKEIVEAMFTGQGDKLAGYLYFPEEVIAEPGAKEMFEGKFKAGTAETKQLADSRGGIKSTKVLNSEVDEKAGTATVMVQINFKNSDAETEETMINLIKHQGKWLLDFL